MKLRLADPTGLCFGVRRAIEALEAALAEHGTVYALGSPIHNPQEVARLIGLGLVVVDDADEVPQGGVAFIRAHGVGPGAVERLQGRSAVIVDGTCPFVRRAQERASHLEAEGYQVFLVGDRDHPEVQGITARLGRSARVVGSSDEIGEIDDPGLRAGVLSQTTQKAEVFAGVVADLCLKVSELKVFNTICNATAERQNAVRQLARQVDGIIVIGGKNSANTRKLVEISRSQGAPTLWIEKSEELDWRWLEGKLQIGVAAGASTPDWLIKKLITTLAIPQVAKGEGN
ncbi:MAG: 4-hydroxy-3-methylbut-2-enyl diphosphate reductase [Synergistales bacterium]|jgi:4-hydroxy-3-methylbut-2-enyl diphosphate reductase|nr:4-hydroxy-3-methylbut-2-enyl diphosphate reductase [Synergistales bacterium]